MLHDEHLFICILKGIKFRHLSILIWFYEAANMRKDDIMAKSLRGNKVWISGNGIMMAQMRGKIKAGIGKKPEWSQLFDIFGLILVVPDKFEGFILSTFRGFRRRKESLEFWRRVVFTILWWSGWKGMLGSSEIKPLHFWLLGIRCPFWFLSGA